MKKYKEEADIFISVKELKTILRGSYGAFIRLVEYIRVNYVMDELWDGKAELKFRKSGKTLVTIAVKDGAFNVLVIFGKAEREVFDTVRTQFSDYICSYYDNSRTYHDGKWMFIDIADETYVDDLIRLLAIKKKPNRKKEKTI